MKNKKEQNTQIGARIKTARENRRYTQAQLSELIDVSPQFISDIERGMVGISFDTLTKMCQVLNVSADWLLFGSGDISPSIELIIAKLKRLNADQLQAINAMIDNALSLIQDKD